MRLGENIYLDIYLGWMLMLAMILLPGGFAAADDRADDWEDQSGWDELATGPLAQLLL